MTDKLLKNLKPLKEVRGNLPYIFDLQWDVKTVDQFIVWKLYKNEDALRLLREHGYDVKSFLKELEIEK